MSLLDRLRSLISASPARSSPTDKRGFMLQVRCRRCGEIIPVRIDLDSALSPDYDVGGYTARKTVVGSGQNRCFQRIELSLHFDQNKKLIGQSVVGGEIVA